MCQEYDCFTNDCPMTKEKGETEQIQQFYNLDEEETSLKALATETYSLGDIALPQEHLNL